MKKFPDIRDIPDGLEEGLSGVLEDMKECLEVMLSRRDDYLPEEGYDPVNKNYIDLPIPIQTTSAKMYAGEGSPEGVIIAEIGSIYLRTDGSTDTVLYVKESGATSLLVEATGWVAK